jgi:hypothetical protein
MSIILALILLTTADQQTPVQRVPIEIFQVVELPITISETGLVKTNDGYLLTCRASNNSEFSLRGLRYSLVLVDSMNVATTVVIRNESLKLPQYQTRNLTFRTPIKLKMKADNRLVLMLEHVVSTDYVWEVIKPTEALSGYLAGDYSIVPRVRRLSNHVDTPPRRRVIY